MTVELGGYESQYYVGILVVLAFGGLFMPWRLSATAAFCGASLFAYVGINLVLFGVSVSMAAPCFFLFAISAFMCISTETTDSQRRRDLMLRMELEKLDELKTHFFANVSHELRTPLTLSLGPVESIVYGPSANGRLFELQQKSGGRLLTDIPKPTYEQDWVRHSINVMRNHIAKGGKIRFDLTHMKDISGILNKTGPYRAKVTSYELRWLRDNWSSARDNVIFYDHGIEVKPPWL